MAGTTLHKFYGMRPQTMSTRIFLCNGQPHELHTKNWLSKRNFLTRNGLHEMYVMSRKLVPLDFLICMWCFSGAGYWNTVRTKSRFKTGLASGREEIGCTQRGSYSAKEPLSLPKTYPYQAPSQNPFILCWNQGIYFQHSYWRGQVASPYSPLQAPTSCLPEKVIQGYRWDSLAVSRNTGPLSSKIPFRQNYKFSRESLDNGRILFFPQSGGSLETLESLTSLESPEIDFSEKTRLPKSPFSEPDVLWLAHLGPTSYSRRRGTPRARISRGRWWNQVSERLPRGNKKCKILPGISSAF